MPNTLKQNFFNSPTVRVAQDLLGKFLVRKIGRKKISGIITEVEAYVGPEDKASHASRGKTPRTEVMFGPPGYWYVYLIYGKHSCLNIVTEEKGYPAAVLIRSVDHTKGPGRVCKKFKIDRKLNNKPASKITGLWIAAHPECERAPPNRVGREDRGTKIKKGQIKRGKRIGVDYAGKWKDKFWRFYL